MAGDRADSPTRENYFHPMRNNDIFHTFINHEHVIGSFFILKGQISAIPHHWLIFL